MSAGQSTAIQSRATPAALTAADIKRGRLYRGKKPRKNVFTGDYDDRVVLHIDQIGMHVQYDSYFVANGRHYPKVTMEKFLRWASHEVPNEV